MINKIIATYFLQLARHYQDKVLSKLGTPSPKIQAYNEAVVIFCYRWAIKLNPNFPEAHCQLGALLAKQKKWQEAAANFRQAIKKAHPYPFSSYFNLGRMLLKLQKFEEGIPFFRSALELKPYHLWSRIYLGDALSGASKIYEAIQTYQSALESKSNNPRSCIHLGDALTEVGEISEAIRAYQSALCKKISKTHPHFKPQLQNAQQLSVPNFLIIGQGKCGTTSLYHYLTQHPQILPALIKELNFWDNKSNFARGLDWYLANFIPIYKGQKFITGEASPTYLYFSEPQQIFQVFPEMKLIILLRNPIDRTISAYHMFVRQGRENRPLKKAIFSELKTITQQRQVKFNHLSYLRRAMYIYEISRWMKIFPKEQFLILKSEDFFATPGSITKQVFQFLGVEPYQLQDYPKQNSGNYPPISQSMRRILSDYFRPYNQQLEEYLDRKFNWD